MKYPPTLAFAKAGAAPGTTEVWNLLCHSHLSLRHSSLPLPGFKRLKLLKPLKPSNSLAAASTKPSGRQPLLLQGCSLPFACTSLAAASTKLLAVSVPALQPALCLHIALIRACRFHPALLGPSSLPFARLQTQG